MIERLVVTYQGGPYDGTVELQGGDAYFPHSPENQRSEAFFAVDLRQRFEKALSQGATIVGKHFAAKLLNHPGVGAQDHYYKVEEATLADGILRVTCRSEGAGPA